MASKRVYFVPGTHKLPMRVTNVNSSRLSHVSRQAQRPISSTFFCGCRIVTYSNLMSVGRRPSTPEEDDGRASSFPSDRRTLVQVVTVSDRLLQSLTGCYRFNGDKIVDEKQFTSSPRYAQLQLVLKLAASVQLLAVKLRRPHQSCDAASPNTANSGGAA